MIIYRSSATFRDIVNQIITHYRLGVILSRTKPVDSKVMQAIGYAAQVRVKHACQPVFNSLSNLEKAYASLDYTSVDRRLTVVRTNMGLCLRNRGEL